MARGAHTSPQRTLFKKRRKSYLKNKKRVEHTNQLLSKFKQQLQSE